MKCPLDRLALLIQVTSAVMSRPFAELPMDTVWYLFFLTLLELSARNGLDLTNGSEIDEPSSPDRVHVTPPPGGPLVARMEADQTEPSAHCPDPQLSDDTSTLPAEDGPHTERDGHDLEVDADYFDWDTPLYDPFDRPEGEVVVQAFSPSRSRSPRRARSV